MNRVVGHGKWHLLTTPLGTSRACCRQGLFYAAMIAALVVCSEVKIHRLTLSSSWLFWIHTSTKGVPLVEAADRAGVPLRTARRWLAAYKADGAAGLDVMVLDENSPLARPSTPPLESPAAAAKSNGSSAR